MDKKYNPIVVEQIFNASVDKVWEAITRAELMRKWFFDNIPEFNPEIGFKTKFNVKSGGRDFLHLWEVTEAIPEERLTYNWRYDGYSGDSYVSFEILGQENQTNLKVTYEVMESFPDGIPEFKRENCHSGWEYFIGKSLKEFMEKI